MIDARARDATRSALIEVAAIVLPDAETVIATRRARHRARLARASAAILVLFTLTSGVAVLATRSRSTGHIATSRLTPTTAPSRAGLSLNGTHAGACHTELFQAVFGCDWETHAATSSDIAAVSVRDTRANGWVVDLTLTPAATTRFAQDTIMSASVDGAAVNVTRGEHGTVELAGVATESWDAKTAYSIAARILDTR
jgi:hypothetical protein